MAKGNHSFTEQDIRKRFGAIVGHTVADDGACDRRSGERHRKADHGDKQNVLDDCLPLQAAGKSTRYPPPKGIAAACMCGSLRSGFVDTA